MSLIWLPPIAAAALGLIGPRYARRLDPASAVRLLTFASLATSLACGFVLTAAGFLVLAGVPVIASLGQWSIAGFGNHAPIEMAMEIIAGGTALVLLARAARRACNTVLNLVRSARTCRRLDNGYGDLTVLDSARPDAFALPGLPGRVVVSTSMLRALPAEERRVLLAHEAAHLRHHHHLYVEVAELAAAANPLLGPVARAVRTGVERWADEDAAVQTGDRLVAARALARAGVVRARTTAVGDGVTPRLALPAADGEVAERVRALLEVPARPRLALAGVLILLTTLAVGAAFHTESNTESRLDHAQAVFDVAADTMPGTWTTPTLDG